VVTDRSQDYEGCQARGGCDCKHNCTASNKEEPDRKSAVLGEVHYLRESIRSKAIKESRLMSSCTVISLRTTPSRSPSSIQSR
jgi:hypothetical protein